MLVHAFEKGEVVEAPVAAFECGRKAGRQDADRGIGFLCPPIGTA